MYCMFITVQRVYMDEVCLCAERGCTSGRRVRLDLTLDVPTSPATRLSPAEARALLGAVGLGEVPTLDRPSRWHSPQGRPTAVAALAAAATAVWAADTLAGLAVAGRRLAARHRRAPLPARRVLARGGLHQADVGAARHGRHAPRRRLLRHPLGPASAFAGHRCWGCPGPSAPGPRCWGCPGPSAPARPARPALSLSLVCGSSQLGSGHRPERPGPGIAGSGQRISRMFCGVCPL